ncbi:hypothetical protein IB270_31955 [Ensifer sp. ENS05]|nr:hypothetical protein [Ensifer sp. ENS05]
MRLLLINPDIAAFGSLSSVAQRCGVSKVTITRLASLSGYSSFREMKAAFQQHLVSVAGKQDGRARQQRRLQ